MQDLGGGISKYHVCNSNLMRNGADYSVFINTAFETGVSDEVLSWGKIIFFWNLPPETKNFYSSLNGPHYLC